LPASHTNGTGACDQKDSGFQTNGANICDEKIGFDNHLRIGYELLQAVGVKAHSFRSARTCKSTADDIRRRRKHGDSCGNICSSGFFTGRNPVGRSGFKAAEFAAGIVFETKGGF